MGCEGCAGTPDEFARSLRTRVPAHPTNWKDDTKMFDHHKVELNWGGQPLTLETGKIARQADGAVLATLGETVVLATVVSAKEPKPGQVININIPSLGRGEEPAGVKVVPQCIRPWADRYERRLDPGGLPREMRRRLLTRAIAQVRAAGMTPRIHQLPVEQTEYFVGSAVAEGEERVLWPEEVHEPGHSRA